MRSSPTCRDSARTRGYAADVDINDFRSFFLVLIFVGFIGVWIWAWRKERKPDFDESARLPLEEDDVKRDNERETG